MDGTLRTARLELVPASLEELRVKFDGPGGAPPGVSPKWIEKLRSARSPDPWEFGYTVLLAESGQPIGGVSFKGAPGPDGVVEIAYGIDEEFQRRGYATEAAGALVTFAFADPRVRVVCAHTLPGAIVSSRVLDKCGFSRVGDVVDPENGPVWRFEKARPR
jgi:[ribosomal protein S5]-alanine N-acetyltransferase